jgi:putative sigma-54 modulation protein
MLTPPQIVFQGMDPSPALETRVREKIAWLEKYFKRITHTRVVIEAPHRRRHKGKTYRIKIELGMPGRADLVVSHDHELDPAHEDIRVAITHAFEAARRQLEDLTDKMEGKVKTLRGGKNVKPKRNL